MQSLVNIVHTSSGRIKCNNNAHNSHAQRGARQNRVPSQSTKLKCIKNISLSLKPSDSSLLFHYYRHLSAILEALSFIIILLKKE